MRDIRLAIAALAAALLAMIGPARADLITQSTLSSGQTRQHFSFGGNFNQFDPALGTLNTVRFNYSGDLTFYTTFTLSDRCFDGVYCNGQVSYSVGFNFNGPGFPIRDTNSSPFYNIVNTYVFADASNLAPQTTGPFQVGIAPLDADLSALSSYIGIGLVTVAGAVSEDSDFCDDGGVRCTLSDNLNLTSTLVYDFTPIPEPFTLSLFGAGAIGLGALRRPKKKVA
jgi:hypothetical protein